MQLYKSKNQSNKNSLSKILINLNMNINKKSKRQLKQLEILHLINNKKPKRNVNNHINQNKLNKQFL